MHTKPEPHEIDPNNPGYETQDVNVSGIVVFLGGLMGFVVIFFFFCFFMGKVINTAFEKQDGPLDKWHAGKAYTAGVAPGKREDLANNTEMQQRELQQMTKSFPNPRLDIDDGNQATADLHAREDLLLTHYSKGPGQAGVRIPVTRAMELIAERGLPVLNSVDTVKLAEDRHPVISSPLTTGFARTGYELDVMEARAQKMSYGKAESAAHPELQAAK